MSSPLRQNRDVVQVRVRVQPGASCDAIGGLTLDAAGEAFIKLRVTQPAEGGKANRAVARMLAKAWRVPVSTVTVVSGHKDRRKTLEVSGGREVAERINHWLGSLT